MRLVFLGLPGAGKSTQAAIIAEEQGIPQISTGQILVKAIAQKTALGIQAQSYLEAGKLVPDILIMTLIQERLTQLDAQKGWILDGFPRNLAQAEAFDQLLETINQSCLQLFNFHVDTETLIERMLQRRPQEDNQAAILHRLEAYHEKTTPLINYYQKRGCLININGNLPVARVTQSIQEVLFKQ
jgi:adenylate kinase